jgi:beta-1,4-mannosyl-glycoprotein beta-1,4-N-acetylglucosaminyltransferase
MIIDCFIFYNELELLKKRLTYLSPVVDKFVIVESTVTFRGTPKELYFEKNRSTFSEWEDKIVHVIVDDNPTGENPWEREHFQRDCIKRGIKDFDDDAIVMISDVDEIPNIKYITLPHESDICSFNMVAFQYSLEYVQELEPWFGTILTRKGILTQASPQELRDRRWAFPFYRNAGWHFSSFGDETFIANKIRHFSHCHDESVKNKDETTFKMYIERGLHTDGTYKLLKPNIETLENIPMELR